ncbi:MAG: HD-GYP domain-containing protein [bacterium JZ-2024 1]
MQADDQFNLKKLLELSRRLSTERDPDRLLKVILERSVATTGAEGGTVYLYDQDADALLFRHIISPDPVVAQRLKGMTLKIGEGIAGRVAQTRRSEHISDATADPRFARVIDQKSGFVTRSLLTVPLHYTDPETGRHYLLGVLQLVNKSVGDFTTEDAEWLEAFGGFAASLMARANLFLQLKRQYLGTIASLAEAVDAKDPYTHGHSLRVAAYSVALGEAIGLGADSLFDLRVSSVLHDIGKIAIPDAILLKKGRLTDEEYMIIKTHVREGVRILKPVRFHTDIYDGILYHHEKWDGSGYPEGRSAHAIPTFARIIAFADAYDTITTERPYKRALTHEEARQVILKDAGSHFDPEFAMEFTRLPLEEIGTNAPSRFFASL